MTKVKSFFKGKNLGTILVFIVLFLFFSTVSNKFLTVSNMLNILLQISTMMIVSMGMTWIIITGGIDLSVGASLAFSGVVTAMLIKYAGVPVWIGVFVCMLLSGLVGAVNGILITVVRIPPLLATIGMSSAVRGLAFIICGGDTIFGLPSDFTVLGRGYIGIVPIPVLIAVVVVAIFWFVQNKTAFSVYTYAIGNNVDSAYLSGIKTNLHIFSLYVISGLLVGLAGFINASRTGVGLASTGEDMDFNVVTAVVLGGTSIAGGSGKISGTVLGCIIMGVLANGMMIMNMHSFAQQFVKGVILLLAIGAETIRQKKEL